MESTQSSTEMSTFARTVYEDKYSMKDPDGRPAETWAQTAHRVASHVLDALPTR